MTKQYRKCVGMMILNYNNEILVGKVKVLKKTKSLVFISSEIFGAEKIVATASGTWKIL